MDLAIDDKLHLHPQKVHVVKVLHLFGGEDQDASIELSAITEKPLGESLVKRESAISVEGMTLSTEATMSSRENFCEDRGSISFEIRKLSSASALGFKKRPGETREELPLATKRLFFSRRPKKGSVMRNQACSHQVGIKVKLNREEP